VQYLAEKHSLKHFKEHVIPKYAIESYMALGREEAQKCDSHRRAFHTCLDIAKKWDGYSFFLISKNF
jgi:hypothetical protein